MSTNPYRDVFYQQQANWHKLQDGEAIVARHEKYRKRYKWQMSGWLPDYKTGNILEIGCGSGQFLHFLKTEGYESVLGLDLDHRQVQLAQELGFNVTESSVLDFLVRSEDGYDMVVMLDLLSHLTKEEIFPILREVFRRLRTGGKLVVSVPNAESPTGPSIVFGDITHETAFTSVSVAELLYCHGFELKEIRDQGPIGIDLKHKIERLSILSFRKLAGMMYRLVGLHPPRFWSDTIWALAEKPAAREEAVTRTGQPGPLMDPDQGRPPIQA